MYKLYKTSPTAVEANGAYYTNEKGQMVSFLFDPDNTDYQAYLKWVEAGNTPLPADEQGA